MSKLMEALGLMEAPDLMELTEAPNQDAWATGLLTPEDMAERRASGGRNRHYGGPPGEWLKRMIELPFERIAHDLAAGDARRDANRAADAKGLEGRQRSRFVAAYMDEHAAAIKAEADIHIENVEQVLAWHFVACPRCTAEQWMKTEKSVMGGVLEGGRCACCGGWLDSRNWRVIEYDVVAPPTVYDLGEPDDLDADDLDADDLDADAEGENDGDE